MLSLIEQYEFLFNGKPVAYLTGEEFKKEMESDNLKLKINTFFNSIGNKCDSVFGEVVLDNRAFKDDTMHGISREKIVSFRAVPDILKNGIGILEMGEHKKGIISGMIGAPIRIGEREYIGVVIVRKYKDKNRLYVHEVTLKEKLLATASKPYYQDESQGDLLAVLQKITVCKTFCQQR